MKGKKMTREDFKNSFYGIQCSTDGEYLIDEIFDYFESKENKPKKTYKVRLEITVTTTEFVEVEVTATHKVDAKNKALALYEQDTNNNEFHRWGSEEYIKNVDYHTLNDWEVEEVSNECN